VLLGAIAISLITTLAATIVFGIAYLIYDATRMKSSLIVSGDRCWVVPQLPGKSSSGAVYFPTEAGKIYISEFEFVEVIGPVEGLEDSKATLGYPDLDLSTCSK